MTYQSTSRDALESVQPVLGAIDQHIVWMVEAHGPVTCERVEELTGLKHQTCSAQIRHLVQRGILEDSGTKGKTATGRPAIRWQVRVSSDGRLF